MKDEGYPVKEIVGFRLKIYSILEGDGTENETAKDINKSVTHKMRHE